MQWTQVQELLIFITSEMGSRIRFVYVLYTAYIRFVYGSYSAHIRLIKSVQLFVLKVIIK